MTPVDRGTRAPGCKAIKKGIRSGQIVIEQGPRRAVLHSQCATGGRHE